MQNTTLFWGIAPTNFSKKSPKVNIDRELCYFNLEKSAQTFLLFSQRLFVPLRTYVQIRNIQRPIQSQPAAGAARGADTAGADPHAGRRQPDGRPLRRQRPHAAGRRVVRRRRLLHPLHRRHRHRTGHDAPRGRTLRAGRPREIVGTAPERHSLLRTAGRGDGRRAVRRHSADVPPRLDVEESSRIELQDGYTLILVDIPTIEIRHDQRTYTTIPLGIILTQDIIVTICTEDTPVLQNFVRSRVKEFSTKKKLRFVYQILYRTAAIYQANLRIIDKRRTEIEERVGSDTDDSDLINLHELESTLVYFATSLRANGVVLDRLTRYKRLEQYPEDKELLDDVIVENRQAIEMTTIYRDIINGTRELMSSLLDNRLNNVMKYLTSITIVMAIPTVISGIYGMNVNENWMPFANTPHGFLIICIITLLICIITMLFLRKKKML